MLFVCELNLVRWIVAKASNHRDFLDYAWCLLLAGPFLIGYVLRRRVNRMQTTSEVSPKAAAQISSDISGLVFVTYCLLLIFTSLYSIAK